MAMTAKERKQKQLERERDQLRKTPDSTYPFLKIPFFERTEDDGNWSSVDLCFELIGMDPPAVDDDRGPEAFAHDVCFATDEDRQEAFQSYEKSIGRAEFMMDMLLDAATELASIINNHKRSELKSRLKELETADLSDQSERAEALKKAAVISKLLEDLDKNVRRTFPVWTLKNL